jgi:hypothetical protein
MKNITITLDPETAAWIRVQAAEKNMSVSRSSVNCFAIVELKAANMNAR